jgi:hypothetical protein
VRFSGRGKNTNNTAIEKEIQNQVMKFIRSIPKDQRFKLLQQMANIDDHTFEHLCDEIHTIRIFNRDNLRFLNLSKFLRHLEQRDNYEDMLAFLCYLQLKGIYRPLLIFDNVDTLSAMSQDIMMNCALQLSSRHHLPTIVALRDTSLTQILRHGTGIRAHYFWLERLQPPPFELVVKSRMDRVSQDTQATYRTTKGLKLRPSHIDRFVNLVVRSIQEDENSKELLQRITNGDVRLMLIHLGNALISPAIVLDKITEIYVREVSLGELYRSRIPYEVFVRAIMQSEYSCYKFDKSKVVNLLDSEKPFSKFGKIIKYAVLMIAESYPSVMDYSRIMDLLVSLGFLEKEIRYTVETLFNGRLLESPELPIGAINPEQVIPSLQLSDAGHYYLEKLLDNDAYVTMAAVDCWLSKNPLANPKELISDDDREKALSGLRAGIQYLFNLLEEEKGFLHACTENKESAFLLQVFVDRLLSQRVIDALSKRIEFCAQRWGKQGTENLRSKIESARQQIRDLVEEVGIGVDVVVAKPRAGRVARELGQSVNFAVALPDVLVWNKINAILVNLDTNPSLDPEARPNRMQVYFNPDLLVVTPMSCRLEWSEKSPSVWWARTNFIVELKQSQRLSSENRNLTWRAFLGETSLDEITVEFQLSDDRLSLREV